MPLKTPYRPSLFFVWICLLVAGCSTAAMVRPDQGSQSVLFPFPPQAADSIRLIIYRPQVLMGMWGKPAIIVNGRRMGIAGSTVSENFLQPGTAFVVDAPASLARVQWIQSGKTEPSEEAITYTGLAGAKRYLRWTLKPTYGHLAEVDEASALEEIRTIRPQAAYVNLLSQE
jgi:hypothetical protein